MARPLVLTHDYDAPPDAVWRVATDYACFARAMEGVATFDGMPATGRVTEGQVLEVKVRLFGRLPPMDYRMEVVACDDAARTFRSVERGGAVRSWVHELSVDPRGTGARLTDRVTVDAGPMTPLMRLWARFVYRRRHRPRQEMLRNGAGHDHTPATRPAT